MWLRPRRRNLVVWSQSDGSVARHGGLRLRRSSRFRRWARMGVLITLLGFLPVARAVRPRWKPLLAGAALTAAGVVLRGSAPGAMFLLPGLMFLLTAPLLPGTLPADRLRRSELERELTGYRTNAERYDLEATLDRYPDDVTREIREILAGQAADADNNRWPAMGRYWCRGF